MQPTYMLPKVLRREMLDRHNSHSPLLQAVDHVSSTFKNLRIELTDKLKSGSWSSIKIGYLGRMVLCNQISCWKATGKPGIECKKIHKSTKRMSALPCMSTQQNPELTNATECLGSPAIIPKHQANVQQTTHTAKLRVHRRPTDTMHAAYRAMAY